MRSSWANLIENFAKGEGLQINLSFLGLGGICILRISEAE
jgi:hypothetical protein